MPMRQAARIPLCLIFLPPTPAALPPMAPQKFSAAIDGGIDWVLSPSFPLPVNDLMYDQRGPGYPRLKGSQIDIGAYEAVSQPILRPVYPALILNR
jgi:hypothetical protein